MLDAVRMTNTLLVTARRSAPGLGLPLAGCAEGAEGVALGLVGLAGLFVLLLFAVPPVMDYLRHREHHDRMVNRRPWSDEAAERPRTTRHDEG